MLRSKVLVAWDGRGEVSYDGRLTICAAPYVVPFHFPHPVTGVAFKESQH
jgi:hypothetical protein